ncbi:MAG: lytic murein transglycosylase, partial [Mesorhizobium sp.]
MIAFFRAPLCPAGHLPHTGGDRTSRRLSLTFNAGEKLPSPKLPISPQVGEMSGRTEGG